MEPLIGERGLRTQVHGVEDSKCTTIQPPTSFSLEPEASHDALGFVFRKPSPPLPPSPPSPDCPLCAVEGCGSGVGRVTGHLFRMNEPTLNRSLHQIQFER